MAQPDSSGDPARAAYRAQLKQIVRDCLTTATPKPPTRAEQIGVLLRVAIEQLDRAAASQEVSHD